MKKVVFADGVHDISNEDYHSSHGISRSMLMDFKRSPKHYWYHHISGLAEKEKPTPAMILGNMVHTMVLEKHEFDKQYATKPILEKLPDVGLLKDIGREEYDKQKANKERVHLSNCLILEQFSIESKDKIIISHEEYLQAHFMSESILNDADAYLLLEGCQVEQSIYFTHKETGMQIKARPDAWCGSVICDLKTTANASKRAFMNSAYNYGYYLQAAMNYLALESIGESMQSFICIAVEKEAPYCVGIYPMDDDAIEYGLKVFNELMTGIAHCFNNDRWPSYGIQYLGVPGIARFDESLEIE